jgi:hypothetical protein
MLQRLIGQLPKLWGNWISLLGTTFATIAGNAFLIMMVVDIVTSGANRYVATFGYIMMPPLFVLGLVLIALGVWRDHRRARRGRKPEGVIDAALRMVLEDRVGRRRLFFVLGATLVNITIVSVAVFQAIHYMDSPRFCGTACHAMQPEHTAYLLSPHAHVACVDCHVGEGASSAVQAKLAGLRQVWGVLRDNYQRPIPTPIHNLRPARETCEKCHWPEKFHGDRTLVRHFYKDDEKNTRSSNVVRVRVGGRNRRSGRFEGLHWHVGGENLIEYEALDGKRARIGQVTLTAGGKKLVFRSPEQKPGEKVHERRTMDCVDCHDRPTHIYDPTPEVAIDAAISYGKIDAALPFIKREGVKLLKRTIPSTDDAAPQFVASLKGFYAKSFPAVAASKAAAIEKAGRELGWIYRRNIFPSSKVGWGTYPSHLGHRRTTEGCFRCHDDKHKTDDGKLIRQDCDLCHEVLADGDEQPDLPPEVLHLGNM